MYVRLAYRTNISFKNCAIGTVLVRNVNFIYRGNLCHICDVVYKRDCISNTLKNFENLQENNILIVSDPKILK